MYWGIINSVTKLHLVGYWYWVILRCTDPWILNLFCTFVHIWQTASPAGIWSNFRSIYTLKNILNKTEIYSYCSTAFTSNTSINPALIISFLRWSRNSRSSALESMALMSWRHPPWKQEYTVKMSRKKFFQLTSYWNKNITFYKRICQVGISLIHVDGWTYGHAYIHIYTQTWFYSFLL